MRLEDDTPTVRIALHALYRTGDRVIAYRGRAQDRLRQHVFVDEENVPEHMTDKQFLELLGNESLRPTTRADLNAERSGRRPRRISLASADDLAVMTRKRLYVRAWVKAGRPSQSEAPLTAVIERASAGDPSPPGWRSLGRWIHEWLLWGEDDEALLPGKGGNKKDRFSSQIRTLLTDTVTECYCVDTCPSAISVHRAVEAAIDETYSAVPKPERPKAPSYQAVLDEIAAIDRFTLEFARKGRRSAEHKFRTVVSGPVVLRHNAVWEIDHTTVDAIVIDDGTGMPIGRARVTCALDRATRCCTSVTMGFGAPSASVSLECLAVGVSLKDKLVATVANVGTWPCFGAPEEIVSDQGGDFRSAAFREACLVIGPDVEFSPVLKAWYRGRIERFFRTLSQDVFHRVPGTTFSNFFLRNKEAIPETVAVCTLDELWGYTVRYIVDVYNRKPHRALGGKSPLQLWQESVQLHGLKPPPPPERIRLAQSLPRMRTLQRYGVDVLGLVYQSPQLSALRVRQDCPRHVKVLVSSDDITAVRVINPFSGEEILAHIQPALADAVRGISMHKHQLARSLQRENPEMLAGVEGLKKAYRLLDEAIRAKQRKGGRQNAMEAARYWESLQRARRSEDAPAIDHAASGRSFVDDVLDGEEEEDGFPEAFPAVERDHMPSEAVMPSGAEAASAERALPPETQEAADVPVEQAKPRKVRKRRPATARSGTGPTTVVDERMELDGLVEELGLHISPQRGEQ